MDLPRRHQANIDAPVESLDGWDGSIAYLDRDGVLNVGREDYVKNADEVVLLKGAGHAVAALRAAGYRIVVVTNQSPVNRGMFTHDDLADMNQAVIDLLLAENSAAHLDLVLYSPYAPWEYSPVRKPGPGMLQVGRQLLSGLPLEVTHHSSLLEHKFDEGRSFMAGDRDADMGAAMQHDVRGFRVDCNVGIAGILDRLLDENDDGDALEI
ncbi:MAG: HAD-IIIA family hydrolase [Candidatus Poseidoniales archaeon]|nr:HAD-IIIA family hydrolase [Candidatus Poseidoniales archaeon]